MKLVSLTGEAALQGLQVTRGKLVRGKMSRGSQNVEVNPRKGLGLFQINMCTQEVLSKLHQMTNQSLGRGM